jgi:hypothetical protein
MTELTALDFTELEVATELEDFTELAELDDTTGH